MNHHKVVWNLLLSKQQRGKMNKIEVTFSNGKMKEKVKNCCIFMNSHKVVWNLPVSKQKWGKMF